MKGGSALVALAFVLAPLPSAGAESTVTAPPSADSTQAPAPVQGDAPPFNQRVVAFSTTAIGLSGSGFTNELAGARYELAYTPRLTLGFGLAYSNLKGKSGRASNVLPEARLGYRIPFGRVVGWPIHLGGGYLPKNGPTLRLGTGFDFELGERVLLDLTLLEPMVWVTRNRPESSLNFGVALSVRL
jgi:hypothetical protein